METYNVPTLLVIFSLFIITVVIASEKNKVPITFFALPSFMQFLVYVFIQLAEPPLEVSRFIIRSNMVMVYLLMSIILIYRRYSHAK